MGRPNLLEIPILLHDSNKNIQYNRGSVEMLHKVKTVKVYCYNEDYPTKLIVDPQYVSTDRAYKMGDLQGKSGLYRVISRNTARWN